MCLSHLLNEAAPTCYTRELSGYVLASSYFPGLLSRLAFQVFQSTITEAQTMWLETQLTL